MLSLAVEVPQASPGVVIATLIPDIPFVVKAFEEDGVGLFSVEVLVTVTGSNHSVFGSPSIRSSLSFPRYRVYFVNTSDQPVKAYFYVNMSN